MYFTIAVTLLLVYAVYKWIKWHFSPYRDIPSPAEWPFLGHNPFFFFGKDAINVLTNWAEEFKEHGLFRMSTWSAERSHYIVVLKQDYQKFVLSSPDKFRRDKFFPTYFPLTGQSLLVSGGEHHKFQKKLLGKAFSLAQMKHYVPVFDKHASILIKTWQSLIKDSSNGENLDVKHYFDNMSFDIVGEICFGYDFNCQTTDMNLFIQLFKEQIEGSLNLPARFLLQSFPFMQYMPFGPAQRIKEANDAAVDMLNKVFQTREKKIAAESLSNQEKNDLLSMMMSEKHDKTGKGFSNQLIKDNAYTFFIAGHETTATALPGILLYLAKFPEYQERCRKEINDIFKSNEELSMEILNMFPFTVAFIKESIRLFTAVPLNGRVSNEETTFGKFRFPKDTQFLLPIIFGNTDEKYFDEAYQFAPERYLEGSDIKTGTSLSFGYGLSSCIGKNFAMQELKVVVVRLLQNFRFTIDPGNDKFVRKALITLTVIPPIKIRVQHLMDDGA